MLIITFMDKKSVLCYIFLHNTSILLINLSDIQQYWWPLSVFLQDLIKWIFISSYWWKYWLNADSSMCWYCDFMNWKLRELNFIHDQIKPLFLPLFPICSVCCFSFFLISFCIFSSSASNTCTLCPKREISFSLISVCPICHLSTYSSSLSSHFRKKSLKICVTVLNFTKFPKASWVPRNLWLWYIHVPIFWILEISFHDFRKASTSDTYESITTGKSPVSQYV